MRISMILALVACFSMVGCVGSGQKVPQGTYRSQTTDERIQVRGDIIQFNVLTDGIPFSEDTEKSKRFVKREYQYDLQTDGRISFVVSSNSSIGMDLAMDYEWQWREPNIVRLDRATGATTTFIVAD